MDRTQLARVIEERKLAANPKQPPIVGYAAMIRVEVTGEGEDSRTRISVIDLATGNPLGEQEFAWPLREADVGPVKELCVRAATDASTAADGKRKVRLLKVRDTNEQLRLRPLAYRLQVAFRKSLEQSERVLLVQHLEAGSSWEESLLLLMGLARLPGGKEFAPQADAIVELRIEERDGLGKTFEETPIVVGVGVQQVANRDTVWSEASGKVGEFDRVVVEAWKKLGDRLEGVAPETAGEVVLEMSVRRKQAEAELRAARNANPDRLEEPDLEQIKAAIAHAEAALKLDPTFAEPHVELAIHLSSLCSHYFDRKPPAPPKETALAIRRQFDSAAAYASHPASEPRKRAKVLLNALMAVHRTTLRLSFSAKQPELSADGRRLVGPLKVIVENSLTGSALDDPHDRIMNLARSGMLVVHRGMQTMGVPAAERIAWIDGLLRQVAVLEKDIGKLDRTYRDTIPADVRSFRVAAAQLAHEDGEITRALALLEAARKDLASLTGSSRLYHTAEIDRVLERLGDPAARREFQEWAAGLAREVVLMRIQWPGGSGFDNSLDARRSIANAELPTTRILRPQSKRPVTLADPLRPAAIVPIAVDGKRVYLQIIDAGSGHDTLHWGRDSFSPVGSSTGRILAMIPLDQQGHPIGKLVDVPIEGSSRPAQEWDGFVFPKQRQIPGGAVRFARLHDGKLFIGTRHGLRNYDPEQDAWRQLGPEQGLPTDDISGLYFLDDDRLYCSGTERKQIGERVYDSRQIHFTVDLETNAVELLHRWNRDERPDYSARLVPMWWNDGALVDGWHTDLLSKNPTPRSDKALRAAVDAVEIGDRRFVTNEEGLQEYDATGKVLRRWRTIQQTSVPFDPGFHIPRIGNAPPHGYYMVRSGQLLMLVHPRNGIMAFDPATETWYGPLFGSEIRYAVGSETGIWISFKQGSYVGGAAYIDREEFLKAARDADRVASSREPAAQLRKIAAGRPAIERAKLSFLIRDYDASAAALREVLEADSEDAEALFLMGLLHDRWGRNKPEETLPWYERLAALEDRSASVTGLVYAMAIHHDAKRWTEVREIGEQIQAHYPTPERYFAAHVASWLKNAQKQIATMPAPSTP
ncbi:MAG: hypothetical protein WD069_22900 [Planctomycetales bacterium]